jgi:insertion element IS1 protein InsB
MKRECLKMYVNGMGFRGIERVKGVHHKTLITHPRNQTPPKRG